VNKSDDRITRSSQSWDLRWRQRGLDKKSVWPAALFQVNGAVFFLEMERAKLCLLAVLRFDRLRKGFRVPKIPGGDRDAHASPRRNAPRLPARRRTR